MVGFIITRHVNSELTNKYWNESYRTIRQFYPTEIIMIIDDNSNKEFLKADETLTFTNCFILESEFPGGAELLPYYYFLKYKLFDKAVILHDSVFFRKHIDFEKDTGECRFVWHFNQYPTDNAVEETGLLKLLDNHDDVVEFYHQKNLWKGCFGIQSVVSHDFLMRLEKKYHFSRLVKAITDKPSHPERRETRSQLERVMACLFTMEDRRLSTKPSIFGIMYDYIQWGIPYEVYEEQRGTILKQELIKVWTTR